MLFCGRGWFSLGGAWDLVLLGSVMWCGFVCEGVCSVCLGKLFLL